MKKIFLLLAVSFASFSCIVDDEDRQHANVDSPHIIGFNKATSEQSYSATGAVVDLNVPVTLIGGKEGLASDSDITFSYELGPETTAVLGDDFDFGSTVHTAVLKAGTTFVNIPLKVNTGNIPTGATNVKVELIIKNASSSEAIVIGKQYESTLITINGLCYSDLGGGYTVSTLRVNNGAIYTFSTEAFTPLAAEGSYATNYIGPYYCAGQTPGSSNTIQLPAGSSAGYTFTDICDQLKLETQNLASAFTNEVRQSPTQYANSTVNRTTGVVTVHYSIFFTGNTVERAFVSTYTPI